MFRMATAHSREVDVDAAVEELAAQLEESLAGVAPKAGLLFAAFETDHEALVSAVRARYPDIELIGCSSAAEMSSAGGYGEDSITLSLFASDVVELTAGLGTGVSADPAGAARQAVAEARAKSTLEPRICLTTPSWSGIDPGLLDGLRTELGPGVPILGGAAAPISNRDPLTDSFQYAGDVVANDAVPILLLSGDLAFSFAVDTGWKPVGPKGTVTSVVGSFVKEIDGASALSFYERYLGEGIEPAFANPLAVFEEASDRFYLRAPAAHDRDTGSVQFAGVIPEGATVQLTLAATEDLVDGAKRALSRALDGFGPGRPDAALLFSCAIRKYLLGTRTGAEYEMAHELFGADVPIAGFYCFGELAPVDSPDATRLHNATMVALLLGSA